MRAVLLVILSALLLVACRPTPSDPVQYLHREDSIIIQVLSVDADAAEIERRYPVPEFTLYGDGTLIYQSVGADGTRLLETTLPEDAVQKLLENIVDEGFLEYIYDQPVPVSATSLTTFVYAHTLERANAVSVRGVADPQEDVDKEYRSVLQIVATLRGLDLVALTGGESTAYLPDEYMMVDQLFDGGGEPSERIIRDSEAIEILNRYQRAPDSTLEQLFGPVAIILEQQPDVEIYFAPLLPFYQNFPEFDLQ